MPIISSMLSSRHFDPPAPALAQELHPHSLYRAHDYIDNIGYAQANDEGGNERIQLPYIFEQQLVVIHRPYQNDRKGNYEQYSFYCFFADIQSTLPFLLNTEQNISVGRIRPKLLCGVHFKLVNSAS